MFEFDNFFTKVFRHGFGVDFLITRHFESGLATITIYRPMDEVVFLNLATITEQELRSGITDRTFEAMSYGIRDFLAKAIEDREKGK